MLKKTKDMYSVEKDLQRVCSILDRYMEALNIVGIDPQRLNKAYEIVERLAYRDIKSIRDNQHKELMKNVAMGEEATHNWVKAIVDGDLVINKENK